MIHHFVDVGAAVAEGDRTAEFIVFILFSLEVAALEHIMMSEQRARTIPNAPISNF